MITALFLPDCTSSTYYSTPPGGSRQTPCTNPKLRATKKYEGQALSLNKIPHSKECGTKLRGKWWKSVKNLEKMRRFLQGYKEIRAGIKKLGENVELGWIKVIIWPIQLSAGIVSYCVYRMSYCVTQSFEVEWVVKFELRVCATPNVSGNHPYYTP